MEQIIAILGQGLVGKTLFKLLLNSRFKDEKIIIFSHEENIFIHKEKKYKVENYENLSNYNPKVIFSCTDEKTAKEIQKKFCNVLFIDNSTAFRMSNEVPLVAVKGNEEVLHRKKRKIIANPNCVVIMVIRAIYELNKAFKINSIVGTSLQAISGMGEGAIHKYSLERDDNIYLDGAIEKRFFLEEKQIKLYDNIVPEIGLIDESFFSSEELKIRREIKKILNDPSIEVSFTCLRVPVIVGHSATLEIEFKDYIDIDEIINIIKNNKNIILLEHATLDDAKILKDKIVVTRLRRDLDNDKVIHMVVASNNILVGASENSLGIYEYLINNHEIL